MDGLDDKQSYRLVFTEDATGLTREIEFAETSPDFAFDFARKRCGDGEVQIFAEGRLLGRIRRSPAGFWMVS